MPADALPEDRKFSPLAINPYVLFRALGQSRHYTQTELIEAMDLLLQCNQKLISRNLDASLLLQQTLIQIVSRPAGARAAPVRGRRLTPPSVRPIIETSLLWNIHRQN